MNRLLDEALRNHMAGKAVEAETLYRRILAIHPDHADTLHYLGILAHQTKRDPMALELIGKAIALNRNAPAYHSNFGLAQQSLGRLDDAIASYEFALRLKPDFPEVLYNLGLALRVQGRQEEAASCYERALRYRPDYLEALCNLGLTLQDLGKLEEAAARYRQALRLKPDLPEILANLGLVLQSQGKLEEAISCERQALRIAPNFAEAHSNLGGVLQAQGKANEAISSYEQALRYKPDYPEALTNLGNVLQAQGRLDDAHARHELALRLRPEFPEALCNLGNLLHAKGRMEEAVASYDHALRLKPDFAAAHSNKIFALDFVAGLNFAQHQTERRLWYEAQAKSLAAEIRPHANKPDPDRRLTIGYVSADFRSHSAAAGFGPWLRRHDRNAFRIVCYSGVVIEDKMTQEFKSLSGLWRPTAVMTDKALAAQIRADGIDILVDLAGHSDGNRLLAFARKPAPVQATLGTGTGLPAIDYLLSDSVSIPQEVRPLFAEAIHDLPCAVAFEAPSYAPEIGESPALARGHVTFGCLNRFSKVSPAALELWARILRAVPESRLLLKDRAFDEAAVSARAKDEFAKHGIDPERIELRGGTPHQAHLATFNDVDIALDPFPANGGISTWEALWMGVPLVTKLGQGNVSSRISAAIMHSIRLADWVAEDDEAYLALAAKFAGDIQSLSELRRTMRPRILSSASGNPSSSTKALEEGYREMWRKWCAGKARLG